MAKKALVLLVLTGMLFTALPVSASAGYATLFDFENYNEGQIDEIGLGTIESDYKPKAAGVVSSQYSAGDDGKSFQVIVGEWRMGDDWHVFDIKIPAGKSNWSGYDWLCFYVNNTRCFSGVLGMQVFFKDGEGQIWGWKTVTTQGYAFQFWNEENGPFMRFENTDWGGMGFGNWFSGYIQMSLDPELFFRIAGEGSTNFDFSNITAIHLRIGSGVGGREDDEYYFDNFLLCNEFGFDPETGGIIVDGQGINILFPGAATTPPPSESPPPSTPPEEPSTEPPTDPSPDASEQPPGEVVVDPSEEPPQEPSEEPPTEQSPDASPDESPVQSVEPPDESPAETPPESPTASSAPPSEAIPSQSPPASPTGEDRDEQNNGGNVIIWIIVAIVVIVAVGGAITYVLLKKKKKG